MANREHRARIATGVSVCVSRSALASWLEYEPSAGRAENLVKLAADYLCRDTTFLERLDAAFNQAQRDLEMGDPD